MAHAPEVRQAVRRAYVYDRLPLEAAADKADVSYNTARTWKKKDKEAGDDWDRARAAARMAAGGLGDMTSQMLEEFALLFGATMQEITEGAFDGLAKAEALSRLSDAYAKVMKAAGGGDGKIARLAVALEVLEQLATFVQGHYPQHAQALLAVLEPFGETLSEAYG